MDIMLDGYIAQTLTPLCTESYLKIFMGCLEEQRGSLFVFNNQWIVARPSPIFTQLHKQRWATTTKPNPGNPGPMSQLAKNEYVADTVYEIFDRKVDLRMGTIVPQPSVVGVSKKTGVLSPIFFIQRDGTLGVPYKIPFPERYALHNATALAPTVLKREYHNIRMKIQVSTPFSQLPDTHSERVDVCVSGW